MFGISTVASKLLKKKQIKQYLKYKKHPLGCSAESTGLEPATSAVTGQRSNQLNYDS